MVTVAAPAKINLTLEVLGKRPDGFHEIRSVLQTVNLCDRLHLEVGSDIAFSSDMTEWSAERSLVSKAVGMLQEATGSKKGVTVEVIKKIPLMSGLAGDSSDAAAILRGLNELWGLGLSRERLLGMAVQLGSDVAFFLHGGTALAEGRGEVITPLPPLSRMWVVLVVPDVATDMGKTARMYAGLKGSHYTDGKITESLVKVLRTGRELQSYMLFNTFENIALDSFTGLKVYKEHIVKLGAPHIHLAGSGPTLFIMFNNEVEAEDLYTRCKDQGMRAYMVRTV